MNALDEPTIFLTAAEASGDTHAANLIGALAERLPGARFVGVGGPRMAAAGCELLEDLTTHAAMLLEPLRKLRFYKRVIRRVGREMVARSASVLVPTDSPALNWHMAIAARRACVPVMYYVAPQVWAWAPWRIKKVRRLTDHVACILPFEQEYFRSRGVAATFVGHPMFDHLPDRPASRPEPPTDGAWRIVLLPGSRAKEIRIHAPAMVAAAEQIRQRYAKAEFAFAAVDDLAADRIRDAAGTSLPIVTGRTHEQFATSHLALATSGTVTLEAAHFGIPMVVFYRTSRLVSTIAKPLLRTPWLSLVNILAKKELVPELMPWFGRSDQLAEAVAGQLAAPASLARTSAALTALIDPLRCPDGATASSAVAELVVRTMRTDRSGKR